MAGIISDKGWVVLATAKVTVTDASQVINPALLSTVKTATVLGVEVYNAGTDTVYIDSGLATATTDSYELLAGERMFLAGSFSAITASSNVIKLLIVG